MELKLWFKSLGSQTDMVKLANKHSCPKLAIHNATPMLEVNFTHFVRLIVK